MVILLMSLLTLVFVVVTSRITSVSLHAQSMLSQPLMLMEIVFVNVRLTILTRRPKESVFVPVSGSMVNVLPHALPILPVGDTLRVDISSVLVTLTSSRPTESVLVMDIGGIIMPSVLKPVP